MVIIHHVTYKKEPNSFKNSLFPPSQTHKPFNHYPGHHRLNKNFNIRVHLSYMIQDRVDLKANGCQLPGGREEQGRYQERSMHFSSVNCNRQ